jgi:hypothetical protein
VSSNGGLLLGEVRATLATVLAPATVDDPPVLIDYPDSVTPPALVVVWDDPWLEQPAAMGPEIVGANLVVLCVGGRIDAGAGIDQVEQLVPYVIDRLRADSHPWPLATAQAPREWIISNVHYLGSRLGYRVPVNV